MTERLEHSDQLDREVADRLREIESNPLKVADRAFMKVIYVSLAAIFIYGLIVPSDWRQILGILGMPIAWAADTVPSVRKLSAASPMPEVVRGFLGLAALLIPVIVASLWKVDSVRARMVKSQRRIGGYFLALPAIFAILWFFWALPWDIRLDPKPTRDQFFIAVFINYRLAMSAFGTVITFVLAISLWGLTMMIATSLCGLLSTRTGSEKSKP